MPAHAAVPPPTCSAQDVTVDALRCYVNRVYSSAHLGKDALQMLVHSLRVFYWDLVEECGGVCALGIGAGVTKRRCHKRQRELVSLDRRSFPELFDGCNKTDVICIELHAAQSAPPWAGQLREGMGVDNLVEVHRFALAGKAGTRRSQSWREYLDGGTAVFWYYRAPGSGVFYRTGATRVAATKAAMLTLLFHEWAATGAQNESYIRLREVARWANGAGRLFDTMPPSPPSRSLSITQQWATHFVRNLGYKDTDRPLHLSDAWDVLMIRLGRVLGYETLVFTTEIDFLRHQVSSSLVDLRSPFPDEYFNLRVDLLERKLTMSPSLAVPQGAAVLDEERARAWVAHVALSGILCVGDAVAATGRGGASTCVHHCNFTPFTVRLACPGHISWSMRNELHPGCYKY